MAGYEQNAITRCFDVLAKDLEPSLFEYTSVSRCQSSIEKYLGGFIKTFTTVLPGAFARGTMIAPLNESVVNMLILFKHEFRDKFLPSELLNKLDATLRAEYPGSVNDGATKSVYVPIENFEFRIQPGFMTTGSDYLTPSSDYDEWIEYDALGYANQFSKENAKHKGRMIHLVRMMKMWNRQTGNIFDGYFIELLVRDILLQHEIQSYPQTLSYLFKKILYDVALKKHDPANISIKILGLHDLENVVNAMLHVKSAYLVSLQALEHEEAGNMVAALECWKKLFPVYFED